MNTKNKLIEKLLKVAKKHKIFTYPVLALVAVISVFHYFFSWSTGAGKRFVAAIMVLVMLVSQSYFLTSSATSLVDTEEAVKTQQELQEQNGNDLVDDGDTQVEENSGENLIETENVTEVENDNTMDSEGDVVDSVIASENETTENVTSETNTEVVDYDTEDSVYVEDGTYTEEAPVYSEDDPQVEKDEVPEEEVDTTVCVFVAPNGGELYRTTAEKDGVSTYTIDATEFETATTTVQSATYTEDGYYAFEGWYTTTDDSAIKITEDLLSGITPNRNGEIWLYARRKLVKYKVTINTDGGTVGTVSGATPNGEFYDVNVNEGGSTTFTVTDPYKEGYQISGVKDTTAQGVVSGTDSRTLTITLSGDSYAPSVTYDWAPESYTIYYAQSDSENAETIAQENIEYDGFSGIQNPSTAVMNAKPGYKFLYWVTDGYTELEPGDFISSNKALQSYLYQCYKAGSPAVLKPYYGYNGVKLDTASLTYQYRIPKGATTVKAIYEDGKSSDQFQYAIKEISADGSVISAEELEGTYGIIATESTSDGIFIRTSDNGPKQALTDITITITITDLNVKDENADERTTEKDLSIIVNQCPLKIVPTESISKEYDGTTSCSFNGSVTTNIKGVTVNVASSVFDKADAGNRSVILTLEEDWLTLSEAGDKKENYTLALNNDGKYSLSGVIEKRPVWIKTKANVSGGRGYVRAGETGNPVFEAEVIEQAGTGFLNAADRAKMYDYIELYTKTDRDDSILTVNNSIKEYEVWAREKEGSNYTFKIDAMDGDNIATFTVKLESPADRYEITGDLVDDEWYGSVAARQLRPIDGSGYNKVRLSETESWTDAITLTEDNTQDGKITFQLYDDTTGAYTSWMTINVNVDLTAPVFKGFTISEGGLENGLPGAGDLYFPSEGQSVSFGNYFNKTVKFAIQYQDNRSNPGTLYYTLGDTLNGDTNQALSVPFGVVNTATGIATAEFEVFADFLGTIHVYAEDKAGNKESPGVTLEKHGTEWAVEKTGPEVGTLVVKSGEITVVDGSDEFYADCVAYLSAQDTTSGIYGVTWYVNNEAISQRVSVTDTKVRNADFTLSFNASQTFFEDNGKYTVYADVTDNAGNISRTNSVTFKVDDKDPVVDITRNYDTYQQNVKLEFSAFDELSGIRYINVKDVDKDMMLQHVVERVEENADGYMTSYCYVQTSTKGEYTIEVCDKAGNIFVETIVLDKVSNEIPPCPEVTLSPEVNENGWITAENAKAFITNVKETVDDKTAVETKYQMWIDGETPMNITLLPESADTVEVDIPNGIYKLKVWSESKTGVMCAGSEEDAHVHTLQVDTIDPIISYELQEGSGNSLIVSFVVKDDISGVNGEKIQLYNGTRPITAQISELEDGSGYEGTFEITEVGNYSIVAEDIAGNITEAPAFKPMSMKVNAVKNISASSATVGARIIKGSYDIKSASISYRKFEDATYIETEAFPVLDELTGNLSVSAVLSDLDKGTNYVYKVTAMSDAGEVLEYVGYFKTLSDDEIGIVITGTARYLDGREGAITVGLFEGNSCIRAVEVDTSENNTFTFNNVPDGNYSVLATDGVYSKTARVLIQDGKRIYPESSSIDLVLSGKNTSVEITTNETPDVTADNMDSLFNDTTNFTYEDQKLVEDGIGTVEFKLYATLISVSDVAPSAISAMYSAATSKDKIVGAYIDLSLFKIVTDEYGHVTRTQVHELGGGANVSVTIPLEDLANKSGLEVIRIHQNGDTYTGAYLVDQDTNPYTYTITTTQFSTYAVLYDAEKAPATTEEVKDGTLDPSVDGTINKPADDSEVPEDDKPKDNTEDKPNKGDDKNSSANGNSSVGSLKSSGSAKTGDETPIIMLFGLMMLSMGGFLVLRKKMKED